jgi:GH25 family lysozyme M1 (1,4-beta-N-acetylmuramidase)
LLSSRYATVEAIMNILGKGSVGTDVATWQARLVADPRPSTWTNAGGATRSWPSTWAWPLAVDGDFDQRTEWATEAWQHARGLLADGIVGSNTWAAAGVDEQPWIDILDVSVAQGAIDWQRVAAAEVYPGTGRRWRGVIVKVSENETWRDKNRAANIAGARGAGLLFGAYAFIHPMGDVRKQVANAYEAVGDTMPSFALALDVEAADASLSPQQIVDQIRRARDATLETFVRLPLVYSYTDFWARRVMPAAAAATDLAELPPWWAFYGNGRPWYPTRAQLPKSPEPWRSAGKPIVLWQYSGNTTKVPGAWTGHVDGIVGDVDRNVFTGTEDEFAYGFCARPRPDQLEQAPAIVHAWPVMPRVVLSDDDGPDAA